MNWVSSGHGTDIGNEHGKLNNATSIKYTQKKKKRIPIFSKVLSECAETTNFKFEGNLSKGGSGIKRIK
jgi:hypothetical protein